MKRLIMLILLFPLSANAALECKGRAFGLDMIYRFSATASDDLSITRKIMLGSDVSEQSGIATYSSTVRVRGNVLESYYLFAPSKDSSSELIALSRDLKSMGASTPKPDSDIGGFTKLACTGAL